MTLRGRLTIAFLAVVLGPVLIGSLFVGMTVATVNRDRMVERLDYGSATVRTTMASLCQQLQAAADAIAVLPENSRLAAAEQLVSRGVASGVRVVDADGLTQFSTAGVPVVDAAEAAPPWRECAPAQSTGAPRVVDAPIAAIATRAEHRDSRGRLLGTVHATQTLDSAFIDRLAASTGTAVTLLTGKGSGVAFSTEQVEAQREIAELATDEAGIPATDEAGIPATDAATVRTADGSRYVRRLAPAAGQPLSLALSVPGGYPAGLYALLLAVVITVATAAVLCAWYLARSTTRPLADLAWAAGRVAGGELDTRVPVLRQDEIGRLASAFNQMTRELQSYVQALTASRDQLRGHLTILGDTLSSTHDLDRILRVILQTALSATGARAGVVLLLDENEEVLTARCAEGLSGRWSVPDDELPAVSVPLAHGVLGAVGATGEPRWGATGRDGEATSADEPPCRTFVAVPICAPSVVGDPLVPGRAPSEPAQPAPCAVLGVLALYDRHGTDEFDDTDLSTLRTFAGQAGIAVNNVRVHEEAQRLSLTDPLTGLWNYRYLQESVRREVERANRFGRMLTVLTLDLDHFKEVNDRFGHAAGDTVLGEFARRVRLGLREVDLAFRQGGEEFVVLLPETDAYGGVVVAERLGAAVRDIPVPIDSRRRDAVTGDTVHGIAVSVSIGIAVFPQHGGTAQQVLDAADDALYAAKAAGRDTYRLAVTSLRPMEVASLRPIEVSAPPPTGKEMITNAADGQPWREAPDVVAGSARTSAPGGAPGGPHPPRQSRGR